MADLFSAVEPQKKKKKTYHGKGGKFSDKRTAEITAIEKENKRLTVNYTYWKRQAERLSADYFTEHEKVLKLEAKVKELEAKLESITHNQIYEETYPQQKRVFAS